MPHLKRIFIASLCAAALLLGTPVVQHSGTVDAAGVHHCLHPSKGVKGIWAGTSIDRTYGFSDGINGAKLPPYVIKAVAESEGLPGVTMYQITEGESTGHPGMDIPDPPGRGIGIYAVNTAWSPHSSRYLRNPILNTHEAAEIAKAVGGPNPNIWHGNSHVQGWNLHYKGNPRVIARHFSPLC